MFYIPPGNGIGLLCQERPSDRNLMRPSFSDSILDILWSCGTITTPNFGCYLEMCTPKIHMGIN